MTFTTGVKTELKVFYSHTTLIEVAYLGEFPWNFILGYNKEYLHYNFGLGISFNIKVCSDIQSQDFSFW